ncbi:hypothetical protein GGX14DRAFT_581295 [Mycena pura]|uniref:Uncharacterized protein n=1 Tax=Mycena pura TaxID=153505 RepID=A0AAD6YJI8_9AGAR|nr:hypothetical protein GGX14DRAFT_608440 [Mycena pura]KAJ7229780.1 hypothetical protein GGX14DRAFT_581295 [Mycena pura]
MHTATARMGKRGARPSGSPPRDRDRSPSTASDESGRPRDAPPQQEPQPARAPPPQRITQPSRATPARARGAGVAGAGPLARVGARAGVGARRDTKGRAQKKGTKTCSRTLRRQLWWTRPQLSHARRYKEGKCVEKWRPGPLGPGTVCNRCRKKMKRVERRGTLEQAHAEQAAAAAAGGVDALVTCEHPAARRASPAVIKNPLTSPANGSRITVSLSLSLAVPSSCSSFHYCIT